MTLTGACVAVGSELLGEDRLDSNSLRITTVLADHGVDVVEKRVIGDSVARLAEAIRELLDRVDVVVLTGGLGPTADDITREAVAVALGRELERSAEVEGWIHQRYAEYGRDVPEFAYKMAEVVPGARVLRNSLGSAPGLMVDVGGTLLTAFPGVPQEMEEMLARDLAEELAGRNPGVRRATRIVLLGDVYESDIESRIQPIYREFGRERVTILARCGVVRLVLSAVDDEVAAAADLERMVDACRELLGGDIAGVDVAGLEEVVVDRLRSAGTSLATAESCTGGMLGARITDVPGASAVYLGGVVSYSNRVKERQLSVPSTVLESHGAVSAEVAQAMAVGVRGHFEADWGVSITGVAGPGGGTADKPVGLVYWAVASPAGVFVRHRVFPGNRGSVRLWSVHSALDLVRRCAAGEVV